MTGVVTGPLAILAATLAAAAVAVASRPAPRTGLGGRLTGAGADDVVGRGATAAGFPRAAAARGSQGADPRTRPDLVERHRLLVALLTGAGPPLLVGGPVGLVAGMATFVLVHRALARREPGHLRRRREQVAARLPVVVDLLAVALAAGAAPSTALRTVASAVDGPIAEELLVVEHGLRLGREPVEVWRDLSRRPALETLGRTMARAAQTGVSVSDAMHRLAEDLHAGAASEAERRARAVGVRAAAPLGLCFLPSFVLLAVVPLVAGTVSGLLLP